VITALFGSDILGNTASFLDCMDLGKLSLVSKQAAAVVEDDALYAKFFTHPIWR